jgi:hypothetical protein
MVIAGASALTIVVYCIVQWVWGDKDFDSGDSEDDDNDLQERLVNRGGGRDGIRNRTRVR